MLLFVIVFLLFVVLWVVSNKGRMIWKQTGVTITGGGGDATMIDRHPRLRMGAVLPIVQHHLDNFLNNVEFRAQQQPQNEDNMHTLIETYRQAAQHAADEWQQTGQRAAFDQAVFLATRGEAAVNNIQQRFDTFVPFNVVIVDDLDDVLAVRAVPAGDLRGRAVPPTAEAKLQAAEVHVNDRQNVHDPAVNKDLSEIYDIMRKEQGEAALSEMNRERVIAEIRNHILIKGSDAGSAPKKQIALDTLEHMVNTPARVVSIGDTDQNILVRTWTRMNEPVNVANSTALKDMLIDNLADCQEHGSMVCPNGRAGRILGSLVLLDANPRMSQVQTSNQYRNEALDFARITHENLVKKYAASSNADDQALAKSLGGDSVASATDATKARFKAEYEKTIDNYIAEKKTNLPSTIKNDIMAALTL